MDIRRPVLAIICSGSPAPGMNGVISSVTLEALKQGASVIGIFDGFKELVCGKSTVKQLDVESVTRIHDRGGCILRTNRVQITNDSELDNVLRALEFRRVRYLVTVGGTETIDSASKIAKACRNNDIQLATVHVPKTIYNDLPLPPGAHTFGFDTAQQSGVNLVRTLQIDCRSMFRWYVVVIVGKQSGHLALGIGKATSATLTLIPEDFENHTLSFNDLCDTVEASIHKRNATGKDYGVALIGEALVDCLEQKDVDALFGGDKTRAYKELATALANTLNTRLGRADHVVARNLGNECRGEHPSAADTILARDLGFSAVRFLLEGASDCMICTKGENVSAVPFEDIYDPKTGKVKIRRVDRTSLSYQVAQGYMIRLLPSDLKDAQMMENLVKASKMSRKDFVAKFAKVALGV